MVIASFRTTEAFSTRTVPTNSLSSSTGVAGRTIRPATFFSGSSWISIHFGYHLNPANWIRSLLQSFPMVEECQACH